MAGRKVRSPVLRGWKPPADDAAGISGHHDQRTTHPAQRLTTQHVVTCAGVDGTHTCMFCSAQSCSNVPDARRSAPAPALHNRAAEHHQTTHPAPFLFARGDELVITTCAPLAKSPNCASQIVRVVVLRWHNRIQTPALLLQTVRVPDTERALAVMDVLQRRVSEPLDWLWITAWRWKKVPRPDLHPTGEPECLRQPAWRKRGFRAAPVEQFLTGSHRLAIAIILATRDCISTASGTVLMRLAVPAGASSQLCSGTLRPIRG